MILIKAPKTKEEFKEYYAVRYQVLREPYGQPKGTEKDDFEPISDHFMAVDDHTGAVVGVAKLFEKAPGVANVSHLAVAKNYLRQGIGRKLIGAVEETARQKGYRTIGTMSRLTSTAFFEKFGYRVAGLPAIHFGTIHLVWMEKKLSD